MGTISVTLPSDGQTAEVADYNTPITTITTEINGNLDNSNIAANAAIAGTKLADASITNAKLSTTAGEPGAAWQDWTPTWTGVTVSSSTVTAKYIQIGKTVIFRLSLVFGGGNGATLSNPRFSLPVTATTYGDLTPFGFVGLEDTGTATTFGTVRFNVTNPTTTAQIVANTANTIYVGTAGISSTAPHTWANTDIITATGTYEAA